MSDELTIYSEDETASNNDATADPFRGPIHERRQGSRYVFSDDKALVHITLKATVLDESPVGVGLLIEDAADLRINQAIEIGYPETECSVIGKVANVQRTDCGRWRVGVELDACCLPGVYEPI